MSPVCGFADTCDGTMEADFHIASPGAARRRRTGELCRRIGARRPRFGRDGGVLGRGGAGSINYEGGTANYEGGTANYEGGTANLEAARPFASAARGNVDPVNPWLSIAPLVHRRNNPTPS